MTPSDSAPSASNYFCRKWAWWLTVAVVALIAFVRIAAMNFPLERDEGEYAYAGQLMLQGIPPYELAYNMKFPGTYAGYAVIMWLFGETPAGIHFGIMCMTTLTALMLYWLGKKILNPFGGMVTATTYAVLATESGMFGMSGHATHFGAFFVTAGLCAMWLAREKSNWLWAGISGALFGTSLLMKQHAVFICAWAAVVFFCDGWREKQIRILRRFLNFISACIGIVLPFGICCLWLWHANVFSKFWFWTIDYARQYVEIRPPSVAWIALRFSLGEIFSGDYLLWALAIAGLALIWSGKRLSRMRPWLLGFAVASALTTAPGFYFRTHYFLLTLPAVALLAGCAICAVRELWERFGPKQFPKGAAEIFYVLLLALTLLQNKGVWQFFSNAQGDRALLSHEFFGNEPFPEAEAVSKFIRADSVAGAKIAVLGSEPEIYFLSQRHSATGYIYMYPLMEPQPFAAQMQNEMIREIETGTPEFIVVARVDSSWLMSPQSDKKIFEWWNAYQTNYTLVGMTDMISPSDIRYVFGGDAVARYGRTPTDGLAVYQRKITANAAP